MKEMSNEKYEKLAEIYKMFGSVPRLRILLKLNEGECTAGDLSIACGLTQSATSHQLSDLKLSRIVKSRKEGMNIFYSLDDNHIVEIIKSGIDHVMHEERK